MALCKSSFFVARKIISFDRTSLLKAPDFIRRELLLMEASVLSGYPVTLDRIRSLLLQSFIEYPSKKNFLLTKEIVLAHDGANISIEHIDSPPGQEHKLIVGKKIMSSFGPITAKRVKGWKKPDDKDTAYFAFSKIEGRKLLVRYWKHGDRMKPFGMKGKSRLVSDILSEAGIKSERLKYFVPLVVFEDEPKFILWIPGIKSAEFGRLSNTCETALQLKRIIK